MGTRLMITEKSACACVQAKVRDLNRDAPYAPRRGSKVMQLKFSYLIDYGLCLWCR